MAIRRWQHSGSESYSQLFPRNGGLIAKLVKISGEWKRIAKIGKQSCVLLELKLQICRILLIF